MELDVITAVVDERNRASVNLLVRNGFVADGDFKYADKEDAGDMKGYFLKR